MKKQIWPSVMAKSQQELNFELKKLIGVAKTLHLDVTDGKFAPSKVFQFSFKLKKNFNYNAHLMIKNPLPWITKNIEKIDLFIPHFEAVKDKEKYITFMKKNKKKVAFALLPETKTAVIKHFAEKINYILILSVNPGFYGGKFLPQQLKKIQQIKKINPKIKVIVDGGMNPKTIQKAKLADYFVSGSYLKENPKERMKKLNETLQF
tara:strand:- start:538 stop:1155 length:618 start_codon:yes stop_codon:yes gene_type:complete